VVVSTGREQPSQPMDELRTEARMLTEALLERIEPWLQDGLSEPNSAAAAGTDCRWCPICTVAAAPRDEHPQLPPWVLERGAGWPRAAHAMLTQHPRPPPRPRPRPRSHPHRASNASPSTPPTPRCGEHAQVIKLLQQGKVPAELFNTGRIAVDDIVFGGFTELIVNKDENVKILVHP
jgi:hypothetical protein